MHVASVVVRTRPEWGTALRAGIEAIEGVEVHAVTADGRLVVTVEGEDRGLTADRLFALHRLPQVLSAALVYEESFNESMNVEATP
jgi:nitrate reductase NapD